MNMCPAMLVQIEQRSCQDQQADSDKRVEVEFRNAKHGDDHDHDHDDDDEHQPKKPKAAKQISAYGKKKVFFSAEPNKSDFFH